MIVMQTLYMNLTEVYRRTKFLHWRKSSRSWWNVNINIQTFKREKAKISRLRQQSTVSHCKRYFKTPKVFTESYDCKCKNISNDRRREFLKHFYNLKTYNLQIGFLAASVKEVDIKRKRKKVSKKRQHSRIYRLGEFEVCKYFLWEHLK